MRRLSEKRVRIREKVRLLEKEVGILGDDMERMRLDVKEAIVKEAIDLLRIEVESLKLILKESVPEFEEKFNKIKELTLREIDPEWLTKKES